MGAIVAIKSAGRDSNEGSSGNRGMPIYISVRRASMRVFEERSATVVKTKQKSNAIDYDKNSQPQSFDSEGSFSIHLGERLRQWSRDHDWYQLGHINNALALKRVFSTPVRAAVDGFLSRGYVQFALQIKTDFDALIEIVKRFDKRCRKGCTEEDELQACEHLQEQIYTAIDDIAALLDNRDLKNDGSCSSAPTTITWLNPDHWITFGQAAQLLAVSKATISNWMAKGRIRDNREKGQRRRVLKADVLLVKHEVELADLVRDAIDIREDAQRIPRRH